MGSRSNAGADEDSGSSSGIGMDGGAGDGREGEQEEAGGGDDNSVHSGEDVDDAVSTISRGSLLPGEPPSTASFRTPTAIVPTAVAIAHGGGGDGTSMATGSSSGVGDAGGIGGNGSQGHGEYKAGDGDGAVMDSDDGRRITSEDGDSLRSSDGLVGSSFLDSYGDHSTAASGGISVGPGVSGGIGHLGSGATGSEGWARVRGRVRPGRYPPRIRPTHERGASPASSPKNLSRIPSADGSGLGGVEFLSSPGGTGCLLNAFCSPLSENTAPGPEMTQAGST